MNTLLEKYPQLKSCENQIQLTVDKICDAYKNNRKLLACGNGGSAADAEHIVGELMKGFISKRPLTDNEKQKLIAADNEKGKILANLLQKPLRAISLVTSVSLATAFANDVAAELIFAQQVYGLGDEGDIFLGISTSGNAENVALAVVAAKAKGIFTIGLTGKTGGKLKNLCDLCDLSYLPESSVNIKFFVSSDLNEIIYDYCKFLLDNASIEKVHLIDVKFFMLPKRCFTLLTLIVSTSPICTTNLFPIICIIY
jgi:D-sedoheptulose 7-phosphate isomerase